MRKSFFPALAVIVCCLFVLFQSYRPVPQSENNEQQLISKASQYNLLYPQEKVYLHLDRPSYWSGDDIWYKGYVRNSPVNVCNLYVELLDATGKVVYRNICWVEGGFTYGDFHLADTLSSGQYQVRAYTKWAENFEEQWYFRKDILVWNVRDRKGAEQIVSLKSREVDVQFLPEGGSFIADVKNKLAFRVTDRKGKGLNAWGKVFDGKGNQVATFRSTAKGIGSFLITPKAGEKYTAEVEITGDISVKKSLPDASSSGVVLRFNPEDTVDIRLEVEEAPAGSNRRYIVIGQETGSICYRGEVTLNAGKGSLTVNKSKFATGIVKFTLFDESMIPRCERLVFVNRRDQVKILIEPDKPQYKSRERVILDLMAVTRGAQPGISNLSVSVYNTATTHQSETYPENILSYFLLNSELRGKVENPAYYFKDDSLSTVIALDNVMLTHGYRYFEWKEIRDGKMPQFVYHPDTSIQLGGKVTSIGVHSPVKNGKVTFMTVNTLLDVKEQKTDSAGKFLFTGLYFNDTIDVTLKAVNSKGKKNAFIEVDEDRNAPAKVSILPDIYEYRLDDSLKAVTWISQLSPELLNRKWHLSDTIMIGGINVLGSKQIKMDEHTRPYLEPDAVFKVEGVDLYFSKTGEMLEANSAVYRSYKQRRAKIFLNGLPIDEDFVLELPPSEFDKIEFVRQAPVPGGFGPAIYFFQKRGFQNPEVEEASGVTSVRLVGYNIGRTFYSPLYDGSEDQENKKNDFRNTLYWNPVVQTNKDGLARIGFYNSDQSGTVQIIIEGTTKDGKLCRGEYRYEVTY